MTKSRRKKSYIFTFLVILLIGSAGVFLTKTDVGFTIVYKVLRQQIDTRLKSTFSIRELKTPERMSLEANYLQFANEDSSVVITVDTINVNYRGIFELLGRRHVDSLYLVDPKIYLRLKEPSLDNGNLPEIAFPNLLVNTVRIENADLRIETPDTLIDQTIDQLKFHYS